MPSWLPKQQHENIIIIIITTMAQSDQP